MYEVREAAVRVILDLYRQHPASVLEYLPAEDSSARRNVLYRTLFEGFSRIDGRPTGADVQVSCCPEGARHASGVLLGKRRCTGRSVGSLGAVPGSSSSCL